MNEKLTRRRFLRAATVAGAGLTICNTANAAEKPVLLGGQPAHKTPFPSWPVFDEREERALLEVLRSGRWYRGYGQSAERFEQAWAELTGAKHCLATANGTSSLHTALSALGVQAGDEVILPPYTFVACVNVILLLDALPVFVDTDPETFQIDARKIEAAITDRTAAIMPVHLGGNVADMDAILAVGKKHSVPVVEDTCQSHLAEWRGQKAGTLGTAGCFSFQASKNLNSGEGGAVLTADLDLFEKCYAFHNNSGGYGRSMVGRGANLRMTEFQAGLLVAQMSRLEEQTATREQNAQHLTKMLDEIPGISPARMYDGCTRNAYHLYMFRYDQRQFSDMPRATFLKALRAEGIPASGGYSPLNKAPLIANTLATRGYEAIYSEEKLARWHERNECPANDHLCQEAVWFTQPMLLGPRRDMDDIAEAIRKIHAHAGALAKA